MKDADYMNELATKMLALESELASAKAENERLRKGFAELIDAVKTNGALVAYQSSLLDRATAALEGEKG